MGNEGSWRVSDGDDVADGVELGAVELEKLEETGAELSAFDGGKLFVERVVLEEVYDEEDEGV